MYPRREAMQNLLLNEVSTMAVKQRTFLWLCVLLSFWQVTLLAAPATNTTPLVEQMQAYGFTAAQVSQANALIDQARLQGIVIEPLVDKIYEGMAKGVECDRILQATVAVSTRHQRAFQVAQSLTRDRARQQQLGMTIANAYAAGWQEADCVQVVEQLQRRTASMSRPEGVRLMTQTMFTARDMAQMQVQSATISGLLCQALQGYQAKEMETLRHRFQAVAHFGNAESVASRFSDQVAAGCSAAQLGSVSGGNAKSRGQGNGKSGGNGSSSGNGTGNGNGGGSGGNGGGSGGSSGGSGGNGGGSGGSSSGSGGSSGGSSGSGGSGGGGGGGANSGSGGGAGNGGSGGSGGGRG
jgi:hypothetical protein